MPEPLTTLHRCPRCKAVADPLDPMWRFSEVAGLVEHVHDGIRVPCREVPVFSAGDMQAAQERAEKAEEALALETDNCELAREQVVDFSRKLDELRGATTGDPTSVYAEVEQMRAREVELAEALREIRDDMGACDCGDYPTCTYCKCVAALKGFPRSHEVVPLGTQDALVELLAAHDADDGTAERGIRVHSATKSARALVEGVESDRHSDVHRCEDCGVPTSRPIGSYWLASDELWAQVVGDDTIVLCPSCFTGRAEAKDIHVSWRAVVDDVAASEPLPAARARCPADHIYWYDRPEANERWYVHVGCDGGKSRYVTPLDDCLPPEPGADQECGHCAQVRPLFAGEGVERTPTPSGDNPC